MPSRAAIAGGEWPHQLVQVQVPATFGADQAEADAVMRTLDVRRQLLERTYRVRQARAELQVEEAETSRLQERLAGAVGGWAQRALEGKVALAHARAEYLQELVEQLQLELGAWRAMLVPVAPHRSEEP